MVIVSLPSTVSPTVTAAIRATTVGITTVGVTTVTAISTPIISMTPTIATAISTAIAIAATVAATVATIVRCMVDRRCSLHSLPIFKFWIDKVVFVIGIGLVRIFAVGRGVHGFIVLNNVIILLDSLDYHFYDIISSNLRCLIILVGIAIVNFRVD